MVFTIIVGAFIHVINNASKVPILDRTGKAETRIVRLIPTGFRSWGGGMWMLRIHAEVHNPTFEPLYIRQVVCLIVSDHHGPFETYTGMFLNRVLKPKETILVTTEGGFGQDKDTKVVGVRCFPVYGGGKLDKSLTPIPIRAWSTCDLMFDLCSWDPEKERRVRTAGNPF